jgi:hypothetical protein
MSTLFHLQLMRKQLYCVEYRWILLGDFKVMESDENKSENGSNW